MSIETARAIVAIPREKSSWDYILERHDRPDGPDCFIWSDDEEFAERWNEIAGKAAGSEDVRVESTEDVGDAFALFFTYKGTKVQVPLSFSRDDGLITIHTLSQLVKTDSDIRFFVDSYHSSDLAFLALSPRDWNSLEAEFGVDAVAYRFLAIPRNFDDFVRQAFADENNRTYPDEETVSSVRPGWKERLFSFVRKHWLVVSFFAFFIGVLIFGHRQ